jgi:hypothetical protein
MIATLAAGLAMQTAPTFNEVTVYNQGFGLVKETRTINLKQGRQTVSVSDVAARIEPTSVAIRSLGNPDAFDVLEQNYQFDLISPLAILNKSVGQRIKFIRTVAGQRDVLEGTLISAPTAIVSNDGGDGQSQTYNGMVIRTDDGRIILNPSGEVEVNAVPAGLISVPTLLWDLESRQTGNAQVEVSYLTQGITWNADYVLTIDGKGKGDLRGWVTINNQSGANFQDAKLKLLAGDVARANTGGGFGGGGGGRQSAAKAESFQEQSLFEYHLYTLQRPATVRNREIKQISLLEAMGLTVEKKLIVDSMRDFGMYYPSEGEIGTGNLKPQVRLEFLNTKQNDLGIPLPKGTVKVYQRDDSGSVQMLGEDAIDHTPKEERISLVVGRSFDIVAERKRLNFIRRSSNSFEETFEIEIRNRKESPETVYVIERRYGDWRVLEQSQDSKKIDSTTLQFVVNLKPGETKKVTYRVFTRW